MAHDQKHTVVLDVMGADCGLETIVKGGIEAARRIGESLHIILVGNDERIKKILDYTPDSPPNLSVQHAETEIPMHLSATDGVRMRSSSVSVGLRLVREGKATAFISPGNTGAVMATALLTLGRIEGVSRPAITSMFPTSTGRPTVVLDVGANTDCKPYHLSQFAVMGSVYSSVVLDNEYPRVGLLSIGEERSKGNELVFGARELLKQSKVNFVGFIEGRDILSGAVEVAVTDGFTGNIILKLAESIQPFLEKALKRQIQTNLFSRVGVVLMGPFLRRMKSTFDYAEYGGAPLLGVNGIVIVCHGSSNARAIMSALMAANEMAIKRINERIHEELINNHFGKNNGAKDKSQNLRDGVVYSAAPDDQR